MPLGSAPGGSVAISASTTTIVGPFAMDRVIAVTSATGLLVGTVAIAEYPADSDGVANTVAGGNASTANANGGSVSLNPGTGNGTGVNGIVRTGGPLSRNSVVTAMTTSATVTVAALLGGIITANQGAAGAATYTLPTGTVFDAALPTTAIAGDSFDFAIVNISTNSAEIITVAGASGMVAKGNLTIAANNATTNKASGLFRIVKESASTFSFYRLS